MARPDLMTMAQQERSALLELLRTLNNDQWSAPSLCAGWTVRDVALHIVSYDELSKTALAKTMLIGKPGVTAANDRALHRYDALGPDEVKALVARCQRPRGLTAGFGGGIALTDGTIHQQDIRRALALPRVIAADQLRAVLDFAVKAPTLPGKSNARGLRLVATDADWSHGTGPEVSAPGEALLMAIAGRPDALDELAGEGLPTLRDRVP
jgi:uncharacterized protein (TIGR03083 family)